MRSKYPVAIHLFFFRDQSVLLSRRFNTGWQDGNYSVPAGHVEFGESVTQAAIREAREEAGIELEPSNLEIIHVMHRKDDQERIDYFFVVKNWTSEIFNNEPDKCDDLSWFPLAALPDNTLAYIRQGLDKYHAGISFSEFGWQPER